MAVNLDQILRTSREQLASDIHLVRGIAPAYRVHGEIRISKSEPLSEELLRSLLDQLLTKKQQEVLGDQLQLCFSRHWPGLGRFRASIYFHGGCPEMAIRVSEAHIRPRSELRLPPVVDELTRKANGLILVTGPTGVGKTTTLNYMVDLINRERRAKIITIEDPVEYTHENRNSIVIQQEVHTDTPSFSKAHGSPAFCGRIRM